MLFWSERIKGMVDYDPFGNNDYDEVYNQTNAIWKAIEEGQDIKEVVESYVESAGAKETLFLHLDTKEQLEKVTGGKAAFLEFCKENQIHPFLQETEDELRQFWDEVIVVGKGGEILDLLDGSSNLVYVSSMYPGVADDAATYVDIKMKKC